MGSPERIKTVAISEVSHAKLVKLSQRYEVPLGRFLELCIIYVEKLKIDPSNPTDGNPTEAIKALRNDLVAFIRTQEKTKLDPMLDKLSIASQKVSSVMGDLPSKRDVHLIKEQVAFLRDIGESQNKHLETLQKGFNWVRSTRIDLANNLIRVFKNYLFEREKLNSMLDSKKIKELEEQTIKTMTEFAR
ncbi:BfmA/BtgA family mobilization protein [uncultured Imperialibacter sp.]|uniref:BfmA/BtgA family mobilization protein n=1 Tax=Imperialibacter sp. TaxID=2038411 RepID=UPI0030D8DC39|tara:strand:+ start:2575 stop:3141 length:567 start_codon:yes stop_codon:yes gene_type:complete